jgi:hypothetical protein
VPIVWRPAAARCSIRPIARRSPGAAASCICGRRSATCGIACGATRSARCFRAPDPRRRIEELLALRDPLYRECAHLVVDTGRQPVEQVVDVILARLDLAPPPVPSPASPTRPSTTPDA